MHMCLFHCDDFEEVTNSEDYRKQIKVAENLNQP